MVDSGSPHESGLSASSRLRRFLRRWFLVDTLLAGFFALGWPLLRSGTRPSRLAYPCQQAAFSAASLAFGAPLVTALLALNRRLSNGLRSPVGLAAALAGLVATIGIWGYLTRLEASPVVDLPRLQPAAGYRAKVFHVSSCPQEPVADRFLCIVGLLDLMGSQGLDFYRSTLVTLHAGPDGIIAADDVVIIKINYQWDQPPQRNLGPGRSNLRPQT